VCTTAHSIRNSIETKAEINRLEAKQYFAIQGKLTENTIDCGTQSKTQLKACQMVATFTQQMLAECWVKCLA
jgi:hypothetical protein